LLHVETSQHPFAMVEKLHFQVNTLQLEIESLRRALENKEQRSKHLRDELDTLVKLTGTMKTPDVKICEELKERGYESALLSEKIIEIQRTLSSRRSDEEFELAQARKRGAILREELEEQTQSAETLRGQLAAHSMRSNRSGSTDFSSPNRVESLRREIKEIQEENLQLRRNLVLGTPTQVDVVYCEQTVEAPAIEWQVEKVESAQKQDALVQQIREIEEHFRQKEAQWREQYEKFESAEPPVEVRVMEVESVRRIQELIDELNNIETQLTLLRKQVIKQQDRSGSKEVVYEDRDRVIMMPRSGPDSATSREAQMQLLLSRREDELAMVLEEIEALRVQISEINRARAGGDGSSIPGTCKSNLTLPGSSSGLVARAFGLAPVERHIVL